MRSNRLCSVLVGFTVLAALAADASAMYHPTLGRFLQRDPIGYADGMGLHEYVRGSPVAALDPSGLWLPRDHRGLDGLAVERAFPSSPPTPYPRLWSDKPWQDPLGGKCRTYIQGTLDRANTGQDEGTARDEPWRHYTRAIGESAESANRNYTEYLTGEQMEFDSNLQSVTHPCDTDEERQACAAALDALARMTHAWQDYFAHAVLESGEAGPAWSADPPITGDPGNLNPRLMPPSWGSLGNRGEHGPNYWDAARGRFDPADRDRTDNRYGHQGRYYAAIDFVAAKMQQYLSRWMEKCRCCCPP